MVPYLYVRITAILVSIISIDVLDQKRIMTSAKSLCLVIDCINVKWAGEDRHQSFIMQDQCAAPIFFVLAATFLYTFYVIRILIKWNI